MSRPPVLRSVASLYLPLLLFALPAVSRAQGGWTPEQEMKVKAILKRMKFHPTVS